MNESQTPRSRLIGVAALAWLFVAGGLVTVGAAEETHRVKAKKKEVELNQKIDYEDEEATRPERIVSVADGKIKIFSKTFVPPEKARFKLFPGVSPITGAPTHVDVWDNPEGMDYEILKDTAVQIKVAGTFPEPINAGEFPLRAEGNLVVGAGGGAGGGSGAGGNAGQRPGCHWSAMVADCDVTLVAMPKVLAADTRADIPIFFRVEGLEKATITKVVAELKINGRKYSSTTVTRGARRMVAGDAVREEEGMPGTANGETNVYTIFVPKSVYAGIDLTATGHYRSKDVQQRLLVDYRDGDGNTLAGATDWVDINGLLDRNVDVCHLGAQYSNAQGAAQPDYPALEPFAGLSGSLWKEATPYTRQLKPKFHWLVGPDNRGWWRRHKKKTENHEWHPVVAWGWRCRNARWIHPNGTYNLSARVCTCYIPDKWSSIGDQWLEMMASEERCCIFVWYWGTKDITDLGGTERSVVDIRVNRTVEATVHLYPDATVDLAVEDIADEESWNAGTAGAILGIVGGVVTVASGPVGWATAAVAYATIALNAATVISDVYGTARNVGGGEQGGKATAFGFVTKNFPDGTPSQEKHYGDGQQGLGGPAADEFTQEEEGQKNKLAAVFHSAGTVALQTWKVSHSMSVAAWANEGYIFHEDAEAWLRFTLGNGPDRRHCRVQSIRQVNNVEEQWVGEGNQ